MMLAKINKIKIIIIYMSFAGLYCLANSKLLASSELFNDYDQKYNDSKDNPLKYIKLDISNLKRNSNLFASKEKVKRLEEKIASVTTGIGKLCETLNVNHNNISICNITLSKSKTQHTFSKNGRILSVILKVSGRGQMWSPGDCYDSAIRIYNSSSKISYYKHQCEWDLGGKSHKTVLKNSAGNIKEFWKIDGIKTYTTKYNSFWGNKISQDGYRS